VPLLILVPVALSPFIFIQRPMVMLLLPAGSSGTAPPSSLTARVECVPAVSNDEWSV
jgi:hypothetical protein